MGVTVPELEKMARDKRKEATRYFSDALGLPPEVTSGSVEHAIECIVSAAILDYSAIQARAMHPAPEGGVETARKCSLTWTDPSAPVDGCSYNHCEAQTPFGRFLLTWKGWKEEGDQGIGFDETPWGAVEYLGWCSIEEAKQWAEAEMATRIASMGKIA